MRHRGARQEGGRREDRDPASGSDACGERGTRRDHRRSRQDDPVGSEAGGRALPARHGGKRPPARQVDEADEEGVVPAGELLAGRRIEEGEEAESVRGLVQRHRVEVDRTGRGVTVGAEIEAEAASGGAEPAVEAPPQVRGPRREIDAGERVRFRDRVPGVGPGSADEVVGCGTRPGRAEHRRVRRAFERVEGNRELDRNVRVQSVAPRGGDAL